MTLATMDEEEVSKVTVTDSISANSKRGTFDSVVVFLYQCSYCDLMWSWVYAAILSNRIVTWEFIVVTMDTELYSLDT